MSASRQLFANVAVEDLDRSLAFFRALGFTIDERFSDDTAACLVVGDGASVMLLTKAKLAEFTPREVGDPRAQTQVILAVSAESRDEVDGLYDKALAAGGADVNEPLDYGFMYARSFEDPDGHIWEAVWMDVAAFEEASKAAPATA